LTQKTGGPVFSELEAESHHNIHEIWEIKDAVEDYFCKDRSTFTPSPKKSIWSAV